MYKVLHFGDTHLGRKHPSEIRKERVQSTIKAFRHCIDKAIEEDVDFVIHAGDVFDTVYPWHTVIEAADKELAKLEEAEIPMYVIRGNHDRSFGQGRTLKGLAIEHLTSEYVELIDPQASEFPENGYIDHDENIRIYGLGYHASRTPEIIRDFEPEDGKFNILLLHDFVDGVTRTYSDGTLKADVVAEKNLDYVAIGHDHQPNQEESLNGTTFAATGGTVDYDFNTTSFNKGYNILQIDTEEKEVEVEKNSVSQTLELRKEVFPIEKEVDEIVSEVREKIGEADREYALKVKITGKAESVTEVPTQEISRRLEELENVILADTLLDVKVEGMDEYDDPEERFSIDEYLEKRVQDEERRESIKKLHSEADAMLANEENLTSAGLSLKKEARQELRQRVEEELFPGEKR